MSVSTSLDKETIAILEKVIKQNQVLIDLIELNNRILKRFFYPAMILDPQIIDESLLERLKQEAEIGLRKNAIIKLQQIDENSEK